MNWNRTKQANRRKRANEQAQETYRHGGTCPHTFESHRNTKLEIIRYAQNTSKTKIIVVTTITIK